MQKLQDSVFSIVKTTNLSPGVFSFLQPSENFTDKTPLGGILKNTKHGWLALGPKFCVVDLRTGLKIAARTFGAPLSNSNNIAITSVVELPTPLTENSQQLVISLECDESGMICILHVNGSQLLHCIQTEVVVTELAVCDQIPDGPFTSFDGVLMAGTSSGEIFAFDLNRAGLLQALKDLTQGYDHLIQNESNPANLSFLPLNNVHRIVEQRKVALDNGDQLSILLNENSLIDGQYIFRNPDGTVRMKAKRDHVRVTVLQYIPQLGSLAVGYNFGAFQIWNMMTLDLEFTSQVNVECLPVTHFGFQEPCDDPRAFCYLWVVFSVTDRPEEEEFPLAVLYSLTYQGKRMLSDTKHLYQEFSTATIRFQLELGAANDSPLFSGKCVSCHTYSVNSTLADEGEESMLNICQIVWECWGEHANTSSQYGMLLFDLDQWYKDQMPATWRLESNAFMSVTWCRELAQGACATLDVRLDPASVAVYSHATRLDEHFYPNSLQYNCICLNTSDACVLSTIGIQRQIISSLDEVGPTALLNPLRLYQASVAAGLAPLYADTYCPNATQEEQRLFLLSVALEARLIHFLKRCAHDWATGSHSGAGCTLTFLVDWCWQRAIELKENAKELTAPLFTSSALPDRNFVRCLEHCVQQLTQLTGLLDAVLTKCCNLIVPDALSEIEEKYKAMGTVSLYFQVVQWFVRVGLLPERHDALPYPAQHLASVYNKRRLKLNRLQDNTPSEDNGASKSCALLYIDQLIEHEFGGDRIHQMWIKGGSESNGLYPPPSLYSLLRLYLLHDVAEEHKHSLVLYLLVDYSMVYDEVRYEAVIRRLMQFPTMFGLSNTAIKATQAFWHLDHRDFDFALDQLQCLTGNTLSQWQHNVVLSSLLAQKKTQAALQYLHVRKPAPVQNVRDKNGDVTKCSTRLSDHDKLEDWQSCCNLYLARGLVFEALDVVRMCSQNAGSIDDKMHVWNFFFKGCRNTGNLSKILQVTLQPHEEEIFVKFLESCDEPQTSDILIMYYLQQARYLEAERYNDKLRQCKPRAKEMCVSAESVCEAVDRESARDTIVQVLCASLPPIAAAVARCALDDAHPEPHVIAPKPMSVYVQAKSPKNTFTYKSSFIQDTIENASETWVNKPKMRKGLKRALNIEDTPFICTPKISKTRSFFSTDEQIYESSPPKRAKFDLTRTPKTPKVGQSYKASDKLSSQVAALLDMPEVQSPDFKLYDRGGADTPHSILKIRRNEAMGREAPSPVDSRYLGDSDDELLETASSHTHYSDSTNKHLRFTMPPSEAGSASPAAAAGRGESEHEPSAGRSDSEHEPSAADERQVDTTDSFITTASHAMSEPHPLESPPKKQATEDNMAKPPKSFKDNVRGRLSLSISHNSSLSDDPNTSIESIADIPITLINPRYSGEKHHSHHRYEDQSVIEVHGENIGDSSVGMLDGDRSNDVEVVDVKIDVPKTPKGRRGIRATSRESTPLLNRSRSITPERQDSPIVTPARSNRVNSSRSRTPEISPRGTSLAAIPELPAQEAHSEPHPEKTLLSAPRQLRSRSRTPDRTDKCVGESPRLEAISESPTKPSSTESPPPSPSRRSLRSRSRTPEKIMSPKIELSARGKKSLSRLVLEANTFSKTKQIPDNTESDATAVAKTESVLECTPMKTVKQVPSLMDVTLSPIVNKSILPSSTDTTISETGETSLKTDGNAAETRDSPAYNSIHETYIQKSILCSYESSFDRSSQSIREERVEVVEKSKSNMFLKPLPDFTLSNTELDKSVLQSYESSVAESSSIQQDRTEKKLSKPLAALASIIDNDFEKSILGKCKSSAIEISGDTPEVKDSASIITKDSDVDMQETQESTAAVIQKEKEKIVEIEREINELEGDMSDEDNDDDSSSGDEEMIVEEEQSEVSSSSDETSSSGDEEIISISDTDSEDLSPDDKLPIDKPSLNDIPIPEENIVVDQILDKVETSQQAKEQNICVEMQQGTEITQQNESSTDPLNQAQYSLLTDDNSVEVSNTSDLNLNYSNEQGKGGNLSHGEKSEPMETEDRVEITSEVVPTKSKDLTLEIVIPVDVDVTDTAANKDLPVKVKDRNIDSNIVQAIAFDITRENTETLVKDKAFMEPFAENVDVVNDETTQSIEDTKKKEETTSLALKISSEAKDNKEDQETNLQVNKKTEQNIQSEEDTINIEIDDKPTRTRTRAKSTSSNKSTIVIDDTEPKIPVGRKRTQSNTSNKSETEQRTPENEKSLNVTTPRKQKKPPTSPEVRQIITRRVLREISGKLEDSKVEESPSTSKRRSTRSRSKTIDDNESIASESSAVSGLSKASEDVGDVTVQIKKGRRSILANKPELSVIPEVAVEDGSKEDNEELIKEYSYSRRLTRNQKAILKSWLEPTSPSPGPRSLGAVSRTSRTSRSGASEPDDDDNESIRSAFDVQPIDRITLLNKTDFEGPPDTDELQANVSPESLASDASKQRRSRLGRSVSESRSESTPRPAKIGRRISADIASGVEQSSTPTRGRRASFTRACEALHTPKSKDSSSDARKREAESAESPSASGADGTPTRRSRRASTQSNVSPGRAEPGRRSRRILSVDESKKK